MKVTVQKLGLGEFTEDGAFYPKVNGQPVGENGRAFWHTREEAMEVGRRFAERAPKAPSGGDYDEQA